MSQECSVSSHSDSHEAHKTSYRDINLSNPAGTYLKNSNTAKNDIEHNNVRKDFLFQSYECRYCELRFANQTTFKV